MIVDLKPRSDTRARPLAKSERRMTLCAQSTCIKDGAWLVDGEPYCGHHAGAAALDALEREPSK